jgi:sugar O-acyltransferase (sialic acid O-acetyltransferase NeuD family)
MESKNLILVGGGGHCKSVIDVAESAGYNILGVLDLAENVGTKVLSYSVIGTDDLIPELVTQASFIITVGQIKKSDLRVILYEKVLSAGGKIATIISPNSYVSKHAFIGEGTVIMHKSVVNAGAKVGKCCIINTFANIEHDALIGDFCHISTGAMVNGGVIVGSNSFIGSNSVIRQEVKIARNVIVGTGSVVTKDIVESGTYVGSPALKIK